MQTTELKAFKKFGPGYFIREQMEMREWTQDDLSEATGFTVKHLYKILQNQQPITLDMARVLGEVFNTSAQYWINIDTRYRVWLTEPNLDAPFQSGLVKQSTLQSTVGYTNTRGVYEGDVTCQILINKQKYKILKINNVILSSNRLQ